MKIMIEWNGVRFNQYRSGAVEWVGKGVGSIFWTCFYYSPFVLLPYLVFRMVDNTPAPFMYVFLIAATMGVLLFLATRKALNQLGEWKKREGSFSAGAVVTLVEVAYFVAKIWVVKEGFERALRSAHAGHEWAILIAVVYAFFALYVNVKARTLRRRY
jgi:hypothetical protein